jgi:hypothetical protein
LYGVAGDIGTCTVQAEAVPTLVGANHARRGGGVYANQNHALVVCAAPGANVQMASNIAFGPGGAIYAEGLASVAVTGDVRIAQNVSYSSGGGICVSNRTQLVCTGTAAGQPSLYLNSADENGGGIAAIGAGVTVRLDNVEIGRVDWPNTAWGGAGFSGGGGIALQDGAFLESKDTRVAGNVSLRKGGGLYMHTARASIGGFGVQAGGVLPASAFVGNTATGGMNTGGGGIYCLASQLAVENALLCSNLTEHYGGAVQCDTASSADLVNVLVCHNSAGGHGAGIRVFSADMRMRHCTVAHNYTNGVDYGGGATVTLSNCIVWGHSGLQVAPGLQVHYCDIEDGYSGGTFILDLVPEFADWTALDYQLTPGSPCIDAGTNVGVYFDCINTPRPELLGFDMGAYEFVPEPLGGMGIAVLAAFWRRRETN